MALTSVDNNEYHNLGFKDMTEDMGVYLYDCPKSILDILSETDDELSLEWRKACYEQLEAKKELAKLDKSFKVGDEIKTKLWYDEERVLKLSDYRGRKVWVDWTRRIKFRKKDVYKYPLERLTKAETTV